MKPGRRVARPSRQVVEAVAGQPEAEQEGQQEERQMADEENRLPHQGGWPRGNHR